MRPVTLPTESEERPYGTCRVCNEDAADGLFVGKKHDSYSDRTMPYKGYICDQCADNLRDDTGHRGRWLKHWRAVPGGFYYPR